LPARIATFSAGIASKLGIIVQPSGPQYHSSMMAVLAGILKPVSITPAAKDHL
jgi:hypothetical protein